MLAQLPALESTVVKDSKSLAEYFQNFRLVAGESKIGFLEVTVFDPPRKSAEDEPGEVLRVRFSAKRRLRAAEGNLICFLDNGRACGEELDEDVEDVLCRNKFILRRGYMPYMDIPNHCMNWTEACAVIGSYFILCEIAKSLKWHPKRRKEAFRNAYKVFGLPDGIVYHEKLAG